MKVSAVLSTLVVAGLVSAAPPANPHTTDLQQPPAPHANAGGHLAQRDGHHPPKDDHDHHKERKDPEDHDHKGHKGHPKRGESPPPKDVHHKDGHHKDHKNPKDHGHEGPKRGGAPHPKDGHHKDHKSPEDHGHEGPKDHHKDPKGPKGHKGPQPPKDN